MITCRNPNGNGEQRNAHCTPLAGDRRRKRNERGPYRPRSGGRPKTGHAPNGRHGHGDRARADGPTGFHGLRRAQPDGAEEPAPRRGHPGEGPGVRQVPDAGERPAQARQEGAALRPQAARQALPVGRGRAGRLRLLRSRDGRVAQGGRHDTPRHLRPVPPSGPEGADGGSPARGPHLLPRPQPCRHVRGARPVPARAPCGGQGPHRQVRRDAQETVRGRGTARRARLQGVVAVRAGARREDRPDEHGKASRPAP